MQTRHFVAVCALVVCAGAFGASTEFTYQGQLKDGGAPANGSYDFQFALFDAASLGAQVGATVSKTGLTVTNGLFTTAIDFGAPVFSGADRFMEISVRSGANPFTLLTPRQKLTAAPYALFAQSAGNATFATNAGTANSATTATTAGGAPPTGAAGGNLGGTYPNPTVASLGAISGANLTNLNAANLASGTVPVAALPIAGTTAATRGAVYADNTTVIVAADGRLSATGGAPSGPASGDLNGNYPGPTIASGAGNNVVNAINDALTTSTINDVRLGVISSAGKVADSALSANVTVQGNTFNGVNQLVKLDAGGNLPALNGSALTNVNATNAAQLNGQAASFYQDATNINVGTLNDARLSATVTVQGNTFNGVNQLVKLDAGGNLPLLNGSALTNVNAANTTQLNGQPASFYQDATNLNAGTLNDARLSGAVTVQGNTFNGASQLVKLDAGGSLPALNGSAVTNVNAAMLNSQPDTFYLNATNINTGTLNDARLSVAVTLQGNAFNGPVQLVRLDAGGTLPAVNGSAVTNVNAAQLNSQPASFYQDATNINVGTLNDARLSAAVTVQGNSFNAPGQLVKLDGGGKLPALDGSALTNVSAVNATQLNGQPASFYQDASNINAGSLNDLRLSTNVALRNVPNTYTTGLQLIQTGADANVGLAVRANSGAQSAPLQEWQNSGGAPLASVSATGVITTGGFVMAAGAVNGKVLTTDGAGNGTWQAPQPAWLLGGNSGTNPASDFVGTFDAAPLEFRVGNARAMRIEPTGGAGPNIIGGFSANAVTSGVRGGAVAGGGEAGLANSITDDYGFVGGGNNNRAGNNDATTNNASFATVGGGGGNVAGGTQSTIAGGQGNSANGQSATVGGGAGNNASGFNATVAGGATNVANNAQATVGGGQNNIAGGQFATVPGGDSNNAGGDWSFAAGRRAKATLAGSFVWADSQNADFTTSSPDTFIIRANGGVGINIPGPSAMLHTVGGGAVTVIKGETNGSGDALQAINTGTGKAAAFSVTSATSTSNVIDVSTNANPGVPSLAGSAGVFSITGGNNTSSVITASTSGQGAAGDFKITAGGGLAPAVVASTTGNGSAGNFSITNIGSTAYAVVATTDSNSAAAAALLAELTGSALVIADFRSGGSTKASIDSFGVGFFEGGVQVGPGGTTLLGHLSVVSNQNLAAPGGVPGTTEAVVSVPGANSGDTVVISSQVPWPANFILSGFVSSPGNVTIRWTQIAGGPLDPDAAGGTDYRIDVWKH